MTNDVDSLGESFELFSQYSPMGRNYGNPIINALMQIAFGSNQMPKPQGGQDVHDSFLLRERSKQFMQLQRSSFSNNMLFKKLGLSGSPFSQMLGGMAGSPNSAISRAMEPLLGGNPMAASMGLFSELSGAQTMGAFGRMHGVSVGETENIMQALSNNVYNSQNYEGPDGYREASKLKTRERIRTLSKTENGRKKLKDMGLEVNVDENGNLDEISNNKVESFDITAGKTSAEVDSEVKNTRVNALRTNLSKILGESDRKIQNTLYSRFEEQMKAFGIATAKELEDARGANGRPDPLKVKELLNKYQRNGGDATTPEAQKNRENIAKDLSSDVTRMAKAPELDKKALSDDVGNKLVDMGLATPTQVERMRRHDGSINPNDAMKILQQNEEISKKATEKLSKTIPADLDRLKNAKPSNGEATPQELRKRLANKIADYSYEKLDRNDIYKKLDSGDKKLFENVEKQNAAVEKDVLSDASKLGSHPIAEFFTGRGTPNKQQLSDSLAKKLLSEKVVTADEVKSMTKDGVLDYNQALPVIDKLKKRQKERVSTLREDLAHFNDAGEAGFAARKRLEKNLKEFEAVTPEELQQVRAAGAPLKRSIFDRLTGRPGKPQPGFSKEVAEKFVDRYENREQTTTDRLKGDLVNLTLLAPKGGTKKDISEALEKKLLHYGVATAEEVNKIKDKNGFLSEEGVKNLVDKSRKIKKETKDTFKQDIEAIKKAPIGGTSKEEISKQIEDRILKNNLASQEELDNLREAPKKEGEVGLLDPAKVKEFLSHAEERRKVKVSEVKEQISKISKTPVGQDKESLNQSLEKKLVDMGVVTQEGLSSLRDDNNKLSPQKVEQVLSTWKATGRATDKEESPDAIKVRNRTIAKQVRTSKLSSALDDISKEQDDSVRVSLEEKFKEQLKEYGVEAEKIIDKKTGKMDLRKARDMVSESGEADEFEREYAKTRKAREGGGVFSGYKFENTRGFKMEEIQQAFTKGAELRMLGESRGMTPRDAMDNFSKNAGGALSAARSIFGENKSTGELMSNMSSLVGTSEVNLTTVEGSEKMEMLLRKVKATARTAGMSIKALLTIIDSTKELFSQNPALQYANTEATTNMAINAVNNAARMSVGMSGREYREAGGTRGLVTTELQGKAAFAQSQLGQTTAALLGLAKSSGNEDNYKKLLEMVENGEISSEYLNTGEGMKKMGELTGTTGTELALALNNPEIGRHALEQPEITGALDKSYQKTVSDQIFKTLEARTAYVDPVTGKSIKGKSKQDFIEEFKKSGVTSKVFVNQMRKLLVGDEAEVFETYVGGVQEELLEGTRTGPEKEAYNKFIEEEAKSDMQLEKEYAGIRSPLAAQFIDKMAKGQKITADTAIDAMAGLFATKDSQNASTQAVMKKAQEAGASLAKLSTRKTLTDQEKADSVSGINDLLAARKTQAEEAGKTELASKIGVISEEDIKISSEVIKGISFDDAQAQLNSLREQKAKNVTRDKVRSDAKAKALREGKTEKEATIAGEKAANEVTGVVPLTREDETILRGLETAEKATLLESEKAYTNAQKGGPSAFASGVLQSSVDFNLGEFLAKRKEGTVRKLDFNLNEQANREDERLKDQAREKAKAQALSEGKTEEEAAAAGDAAARGAESGLTRKALESTGGDVSKLLEQRNKNQGIFADETVRKQYDTSDAGMLLNQAQDTINKDQQTITTKAEAEAADNPYIKKADELKESMQTLKDTIDKGGNIGTALSQLAQVLTGGPSKNISAPSTPGGWTSGNK
jgi:hypothetical protein